MLGLGPKYRGRMSETPRPPIGQKPMEAAGAASALKRAKNGQIADGIGNTVGAPTRHRITVADSYEGPFAIWPSPSCASVCRGSTHPSGPLYSSHGVVAGVKRRRGSWEPRRAKKGYVGYGGITW